MIARRIPLLALAACALGATAQQAVPAKSSAAPKGNPAPSSQANSAPAPKGNLTIQVMDDDGTPVPGAAIEIDGMRTGGAPAGSGRSSEAERTTTLASGTRIIGADPNPGQSGPSQSSPDQSSPDQSGADSPGAYQPPDQSGLFQARARPCPVAPPSAQPNKSRTGNAATGNNQPGSAQPDQSQSGSGQAGSGQAGSAAAGKQPAQPQPPPNCGMTNTVQAGTAESIAELGGAPTNAAGPALPPGAVPLETDAQGQLTVQLPPGAHALSVSVYGFDPFNTHFTLSGKHRQIVQIKLSTAPTSYVLAVGPDGRIQPISADLDAAIPLEPLATLVPLPARARRHGL